MATGTAIVIGVGDGPSITRYGLQNLLHAVPFAQRVATYAGNLHYKSVTVLVDSNATRNNVDRTIRQAARVQPAWDTVLIVFTGHGLRKDAGRRCEHGSLDEHWVLYDEPIVDDHLLLLTQQFASTTRVCIVADCCFAAEGSGLTGRLAAELTEHASDPLPDLFVRRPGLWESDVDVGREEASRDPDFKCTPPAAKVLLLAASAADSSQPGVFTRAFLTAWDTPGARASFRAFYQQLAQFGGGPVLRPSDSALLDVPAFEP